MAYVRDVHRWQYDNIALAYQKEELAQRLQVAYDEERLARDSALVAQREAEAANQAKSTFIATVSHEIRTPMNGVLGMIDVLERTPLSAEQRDSLGIVRYSASALLKIIDDVLDFSKIEAGRLDLERIELSTVELIEGAAETLAPQAAAKGIRLAAFVAAGVPERVIGDPLRLQQILFNLLGNALKFTEHGSVRLTLENAGPSMLRIRVVDTGIGLTQEQRERLFQPVVQADSPTTRRFGRTAPRLSLVRRLAPALRCRGQGGVTCWCAPGSAGRDAPRSLRPMSVRRRHKRSAGACWWSTTTRSTARSSPASSSWPAPRLTRRRAARRRSSCGAPATTTWYWPTCRCQPWMASSWRGASARAKRPSSVPARPSSP